MKKWTSETESIIREFWGKLPVEEIALKINEQIRKISERGSIKIIESKGKRKVFIKAARKAEEQWLPVATENSVIYRAQRIGLITEDELRKLLRDEKHRRTNMLKQQGVALAISHTLREKILNRDSYRCSKCGSREDLEVDHIIPRICGGPSEEWNLRATCSSCNQEKGDTIEPILIPASYGRDYECPCGSGRKYRNCHKNPDKSWPRLGRYANFIRENKTTLRRPDSNAHHAFTTMPCLPPNKYSRR